MQHIPIQLKAFACPSRPGAIHLSKMSINLVYANIAVFNVNRNADQDAPSNEHYLCRLEHYITIHAYTQTAELGIFQCAGLMKIETHRNIVECRCSRPYQLSFTCSPASRLRLHGQFDCPSG